MTPIGSVDARMEAALGLGSLRANRLDLLRTLVRALVANHVRFAFQGPADAPGRWMAAHDAKDLDLWVAESDAERADAILRSLGGTCIARADDPRRLRHRSWWVEVGGRPAIVDLTVGDLAVGPVVLCPEVAITIGLRQDALLGLVPVLLGVAAAVDLVARPILRGRAPEPERLLSGRRAWRTTVGTERAAAARRLERELGRAGAELIEVLRGEAPTDRVLARQRRALLRRSLSPRALRSTWAQRFAILPARRGVGPGGIRTSGTLVVLVGTDGSGKSTVARATAARLDGLGFEVSNAYLGMARGNLPGVALARRLLGVAPSPDGAEPSSDALAPPTDHLRLRRAAAWYYAVEYAWRYRRQVAPALRRGHVVLCDRYAYDLRWSPAPGSRAAALAERLVGRPQVLVLPDAPAELIHARKPERTVPAIVAHQGAFRALLAEHPADRELVLDTSGRHPDPIAGLVAIVVAAAHRRTVPYW